MNEKTNGADVSVLPLWQMVEAENRRAEAEKMRSMQKPLLGSRKKRRGNPGGKVIHGLYGTSIYRSWIGMKDRCQNPHCKSFKDYGGRGIKVCSRWSDSFVNFFSDMGMPGPGQTIERINNDGNYEPSNCKWASRLEQNNNSRHCVKITFKGETLTIKQWSRKIGKNYRTIHSRFERGLTPEQILDTGDGRKRP